MNSKKYEQLMETFNSAFALYLHIPFCQGKCKYCDFYSINYHSDLIKNYLKSLFKEIRMISKLTPVEKIQTIYIGGGTPSLLSAEAVSSILDNIYKYFSYPEVNEITMEVNPASITSTKIKNYKSAGINRISLGIQSFDNDELQFLGRRHTVNTAVNAVKIIKKYFDNFNLDLIFAIPGQTLSSFTNTLNTALSFNPPHLSLYNLQIEADTVLGDLLQKGIINEVSDLLDARMYNTAVKLLLKKNYRHYEISNFARKGYSSRHNKIYWKYRPYLGIGAAAHSFTGSNRFYNYSNLNRYNSLLKENLLPIEEVVELSRDELISEMVFMGLRLIEGVDLDDFEYRFDIDLKKIYQEEIKNLKKSGLILLEKGKIKLSQKGILHGNRVFMEFLS